MCETSVDRHGANELSDIARERGIRFHFSSPRWSIRGTECGLVFKYLGTSRRSRFVSYRDITAVSLVRLPLHRREGLCIRVIGDPRLDLPELGVSPREKHIVVTG